MFIPGGQVHTAASFLDSQLAFGPQGSSKHGSRLHLQNDNIKLHIILFITGDNVSIRNLLSLFVYDYLYIFQQQAPKL